MDILGLGELLIDFAPMGDRLYQANPGGGIPNMLVAAQRQGASTAFIGMVGRDAFGQILADTLRKEGVDSSGLVFTDAANTTLAFVTLADDGERSFSFFRKPGADTLLRPEDVDFGLLDDARLLSVSSQSLTHEPARSATFAALEYAAKRAIPIAYDPNLRPLLWPGLEEAKEVISRAMHYADWAKVSDEELHFLTGSSDPDEGSAALMARYPKLRLLCVTLGSKGCFYRSSSWAGYVRGIVVDSIDSTGAGDGFWGGLLAAMLAEGMDKGELWNTEVLAHCLRIANITGALACTQKGGIPAMPTAAEVEAVFKRT